MTSPLHRHQLLRLTSDGWAHALRCASDDDARRCLALWAGRDHPLVVTRQSHAPDGRVAVGLPAPAMFGRRRLALAVEPSHVASFDVFPRGDAVDELLAPGVANYVAMGGVRALWEGDLAGGLRAALADRDVADMRAAEGAQRGGRRLADDVARRVLAAD